MAAPFTPFHPNGSVNAGAVLPLATLFKERLGITAVWVMGMRGQFDAMTVAQRKEVAGAWVSAGKATGLFTIIQCGSSSVGEAQEVAAYVESIGGDAIGSVGPFEELCSSTECVVDWVAPVAAGARIQLVCKSQSCMVSKLRMIWKQLRPRRPSSTIIHQAGTASLSTASRCTTGSD